MYPLTIDYAGKQAKKALTSLPEEKAKTMLSDLDLISEGVEPLYCVVASLSTVGPKVKELKINGRPAYRCVYVIDGGNLIILHAFKKTTNGQDVANLDTARLRLKSLGL
jgi:phage-related protein